VANLTDHAIHALVERPSSLERIHLSYCVNISIEAIHYLLQRLRNLTHLSLTGVPAFQSRDLQKFCRQPPKVRRRPSTLNRSPVGPPLTPLS
jgi:F-box and leucine-rich repeat protein GRR1